MLDLQNVQCRILCMFFFLPLITVQLGKERVGYLLPPRPIGRGLSTNPLVSAGALT